MKLKKWVVHGSCFHNARCPYGQTYGFRAAKRRPRVRFLRLLSSLLLLLGLSLHQEATAGELGDVTPDMFPGKGYDSVTGRVRGECVSYTAQKPVGGWETLYYLKHVESAESLAKEMNLSVAAAVKPILGMGGSAKVQYFAGRKFNSYSSYALVKTVIRAPAYQIVGVDLRPAYLQLWNTKPQNPQAFRKACGDEFLLGTVAGGEFYAVLEFVTKTDEEKSALDSDISANIGIWSASASLSSALNVLTAKRSATVIAFAAGPMPVNIQPTIEELVFQVGHFADQFKDSNGKFTPKGTIYSYLTQDFESLPAIAGATASSSPEAIKNQKNLLDRLTLLIFELEKQTGDIYYVETHRDQFAAYDAAAFAQMKADVISQKNAAVELANACYSDLHACVDNAAIKGVQRSLPARVKACKKPIYREQVNHALCGAKTFKAERAQVCGVESYNVGTGPVCGVSQWKTARTEACGVERYIEQENEAVCGCAQRGKRCRTSGLGSKGGGGGDVCTDICERPGRCRHPNFGIEAYNECAHQSHGPASYNSCRHETFGVEKWKECRNEIFGVEEWGTCRHEAFGLIGCAD